MRHLLALILLSSSFVLAQHPVRHRPARSKNAAVPHFMLWEKQADLRRRLGFPEQYFVPRIEKIITPRDLRYYADTYKKVDDVFYRQTSAGEVRILVSYAVDSSVSHLHPDFRVEKVHFVFDKDVPLRKALDAVDELRAFCEGGCILNGFSSIVVAQPALPSESMVDLAQQMKPHWRGQDMSDATPGAEIYYVDSPYPVDFEHSPVDRIDLTLVSNAGHEKYALSVMNTGTTVLDLWHPRSRSGSDFVAPAKSSHTRSSRRKGGTAETESDAAGGHRSGYSAQARLRSK